MRSARVHSSSGLQRLLSRLGACKEARKWAEGKPLAEVWESCERGDWMLWLCGKMAGEKGWPTKEQTVLAACACARTALRFVPADEERPLRAIESAEKWARGKTTLKEVRTAAADAAAAAAAATSAYADAAAEIGRAHV